MHPSQVKNIRTLNSYSIDSDHKLLLGKLRFKIKTRKLQTVTSEKLNRATRRGRKQEISVRETIRKIDRRQHRTAGRGSKYPPSGTRLKPAS